ncbi:nucleotidyltransferase domain-containing protein [Candidatus Pacearchaeota archaeon]|nr:nucleotidyltransferase domain-containing protein [Candidatus Pacearchaeota archaeon]
MVKSKKSGHKHYDRHIEKNSFSAKEKPSEESKATGEKPNPVLKRELVNEKDIAMDFAEKAHKRFDRLIKASVLFGSQTQEKNNAVEGSDVDIILIVDDAGIEWDLELVAWYREELARLIGAQGYARELHINTVRLTTWWEDLIHGDPVVINILRYGEALVDYAGFFNPLKALLLKGKVRSTPEAVYAALQRAPMHLARSKASQAGAVEGVYWTMIDAAQAALITAGKIPPSPEKIPEMLKDTFVDAGMLKINYIKTFQELFSLHKAIIHGHINDVKGQEIDVWQNLAEKFLLEMTRIIDVLLEGKK